MTTEMILSLAPELQIKVKDYFVEGRRGWTRKKAATSTAGSGATSPRTSVAAPGISFSIAR
jgi:hypothetical protein